MKNNSLRYAAATLMAIAFLPVPAFAQADPVRDLKQQIAHLSQEVDDLQAEVYRGRTPPAPGQEGPTAAAAALTSRMDAADDAQRAMTGQMEELGHRIDELSQKLDRLQKEVDYNTQQAAQAQQAQAQQAQAQQAQAQQAQAQQAQAAASPPDAGENTPPPLAPASGSLGTLSGAPASHATPPAAAASQQGQTYAAAMGYLRRGQYETARSAFRGFATNNPDDVNAGQALYWAGYISFSIMKDNDTAALSFAELLKKYPKDARAPEAMLKLGQSLLALGQKDKGCLTLAAFHENYPKAPKALATSVRQARLDAACRR